MTGPLLQQAGAGELIWFNNDLLTLKATGEHTDGALLLVEELARQGKVTPLHIHPHETESFFVLDGVLRLHVDGEEVTVGAGGFASVPPGVPHAYLVVSPTARTLITVLPGSGAMEAFFRDAGEPASEAVLPADGPLDLERIMAAAERTGAVRILGPPPFAD